MVPICQHPHPKLFNSPFFSKKNTHSAGCFFASWSTLPLFPCLGSKYLEAQNHPLGLVGLKNFFLKILWNLSSDGSDG